MITNIAKIGYADAVDSLAYNRSPKKYKDHEDYIRGERLLAYEADNINIGIGMSPEEAAQYGVEQVEMWNDKYREGKKPPTNPMMRGIFSFSEEDTKKFTHEIDGERHVDTKAVINIARQAVERVMGNDRPATYFLHGDSRVLHVHATIGTVDSNGKIFSIRNDYPLWEKANRELENEHGLTQVQSSQHKPYRSPTDAEKQMEKRGDVSPKRDLQSSLKACLEGANGSFDKFLNNCEEMNIRLKPNIAETGKMNGFAFGHAEDTYYLKGKNKEPIECKSNTYIKASAFGNAFKWDNLRKELDYEPTQHSTRLAELKERAISFEESTKGRGSETDNTNDGSSGTTNNESSIIGSFLKGITSGSTSRPDRDTNTVGRPLGHNKSNDRYSDESVQPSNSNDSIEYRSEIDGVRETSSTGTSSKTDKAISRTVSLVADRERTRFNSKTIPNAQVHTMATIAANTDINSSNRDMVQLAEDTSMVEPTRTTDQPYFDDAGSTSSTSKSKSKSKSYNKADEEAITTTPPDKLPSKEDEDDDEEEKRKKKERKDKILSHLISVGVYMDDIHTGALIIAHCKMNRDESNTSANEILDRDLLTIEDRDDWWVHLKTIDKNCPVRWRDARGDFMYKPDLELLPFMDDLVEAEELHKELGKDIEKRERGETEAERLLRNGNGNDAADDRP